MLAPNFRTPDGFPLFVAMPEEDDEEGYGLYMLQREVEQSLEDVNCGLRFHKITVESGYYYGIQLYVEEEHDPNEYDNDDCQYYFDLYRSVAIRRYNSEINKINRLLRRIAKQYGFVEIYCRAVFSNGEAVYERVENTVRSRARQAVSPSVPVPVPV